jgi:organic radical activating enzyme
MYKEEIIKPFSFEIEFKNEKYLFEYKLLLQTFPNCRVDLECEKNGKVYHWVEWETIYKKEYLLTLSKIDKKDGKTARAITSWFSSSYIKDFNEAFHMENVSKKVLERAEFKEEDILELYPLVYGKLKEQIECPANLKR